MPPHLKSSQNPIIALMEIIRGSGFIQNIDLYRGEKIDLRPSCERNCWFGT
jgi:hypothetical protein